MKILISGYGRMGRQIEKTAQDRGHTIVGIIDKTDDFETNQAALAQADVAIDFSMPEYAADNILRFFENNIPVVVGTTGWHKRFEEIKQHCLVHKNALLYGTNMSIGMNLFFLLNKTIARLMQYYPEYTPSIEETHHIHKKDAPSGTAITLAEDILTQYPKLQGWTLNPPDFEKNIPITARREGEIIGKHTVTYHSAIDEIEIKHKAFSRAGFAVGAVLAAEWLQGHCGVFTMQDLLNEHIKK